jgi:hypothetical protein
LLRLLEGWRVSFTKDRNKRWIIFVAIFRRFGELVGLLWIPKYRNITTSINALFFCSGTLSETLPNLKNRRIFYCINKKK